MRNSDIAPTTVFEPPTNCWSTVENHFYEALPKSTNYQQAVNADNESEAIGKTFLESSFLPTDGETYNYNYPSDLANIADWGIVSSDHGTPYAMQFTTNRIDKAGVIVVEVRRQLLAHSASDDNYLRNEKRFFKNRIGSIPSDLWVYFCNSGGPILRRCDVVGPYRDGDEASETAQNFIGCEMVFEWVFE